MKDDEKNQYDAWKCIRDHAWNEFIEKTRTEWRLSFGIWAALLSSAGAILSSRNLNGSIGFMLLVGLAVIIVNYTHYKFLEWIQNCLAKSRKILHEADDEMRGLLHKAPMTRKPRGPVRKQHSVQIQMLITHLVSITLLLVVYALPRG